MRDCEAERNEFELTVAILEQPDGRLVVRFGNTFDPAVENLEGKCKTGRGLT